MSLFCVQGSSKSLFFSENPHPCLLKKPFRLHFFSLARSAHAVIDYTMHHSKDSLFSYRASSKAMDGLKTFFEGLQTPWVVETAIVSIRQAQFFQKKRNQNIETSTVITLLCMTVAVHKILSAIKSSFLKPLLLYSRRIKAYSMGVSLHQSCNVFSFVCSLLRMCTLSFKLSQNTHHIRRKIVAIAFEMGGCVLLGLRFASVKIHPAVRLSLVGSKSLLGFYSAWQKTSSGNINLKFNYS